MAKTKKAYPQDGKTIFGLSTMGWTNTAAASFMTSLFMLYLTDYAGIGEYAATLGTVLLFVGRIVDAVDDPIQGFIMDNAKSGKLGKYKPFIISSIIIVSVSICLLYCLPPMVAQNKVLATIWVLFFYLMYDIGVSFYAENPLKQSLSSDPLVRSKLYTIPRIVTMFVAVPFAFFIAMVSGLNSVVGNMHDSFMYMTLIMIVPIGLISLLGISQVKEGKHIELKSESEKLSVKDALNMFKVNKPLIVTKLASVFGGFVWTLVFATSTYYIKWAYCVDLSTGAVDNAKFGLFTTIMGAFQMLPMMIAAAVSPALTKAFKEPIRLLRFSNVLMAIGGAGMFISMKLGLLNTTPALFFIWMLVTLFGSGLSFVPGSVVNNEVIDYGIYKTGKEVGGMCDAIGKFLEKAQTAISSALVGAILIAIGYEVDSVTDTFTGDLAVIPQMLESFIIVCGLVPAILSVIAFVIQCFYPINAEVRAEMTEALAKLRGTVEDSSEETKEAACDCETAEAQTE